MGLTGIMLILVQIISKVFGFLRELVLSNYYGTSSISDAYLIASSLPTQVFSIISVGITASFIPVYNRIIKTEGRSTAERFTSNILNTTIISTIILCIIIVIFAEPIIRIFAFGFDYETLNLTVVLTRVSIFSLIFYAVTSILIPYLNIKKSFIIPSLIGIPLSIGMIIGIVLSNRYNIIFLGIGIIIAYFLQVIIILPQLIKSGYKHKRIFKVNDRSIKLMLGLSLPMIIGASANQVNFLVDRTIASTIEVGAVSALNYAVRLNGFVQGLFIIPIITLLYPLISEQVIDKNYTELTLSIRKSLSIVSFLVIPVIIGGFILSRDITSVLFLRGAFDIEALNMTEVAVKYYLIGIVGFAYREIYTRVFFSFNDTITPVKNTVIAVVVNIILNILLARIMGIGGLALATSISLIISALLMRRDLHKYMETDGSTKLLLFNIIKILIAGITMGISIILYRYMISPESTVIQLTIQIGLGAIIFLLMILILRIDELEDGKNMIMRIREVIFKKAN